MDYLKDCMNDVGNPPIDVMNRSWCVDCANRGCERAGLNQSAFDKRVKNWKSDLFENVPRASPEDAAYDNIRSKAFSPGGPPAAPRTAVFTPGIPVIATPGARPTAFIRTEPEAATKPTAPGEEPFDLEPVQQETPSAIPATPVHTMPAPARPAPPGNTPFEQGMVLDGGPPRADPVPADDAGQARPGTTFILEDD